MRLTMRRRGTGAKKSKYLMTATSNPEVFAICVAQGWCNSEGMTYEDASNVRNIGTVFKGNTDIVHFPELKHFGITSLVNSAFYNCANLESIDLPDTVTKIPIECFRNNTKLDTPNFVPNITEFKSNSFNNSGVRRLNLTNVTKLYVNAFYGCQQLTEVIIGVNIVDIAGQAFYNCPNIQYIKILATTPPTAGNNAFSGNYIIYVPDAAINDYKTAWSILASRIKGISEFVEP